MYLLDTNVVSELRKLRPHKGVVAWIERNVVDFEPFGVPLVNPFTTAAGG